MSISTETLALAKKVAINKNDMLNIHKPYFMFIDDDGKSNFKQLYQNVLKPRNIIGGLSIVFSKYTIDATGYLSSEEINGYSNNGWDIICHSTDINTLTLANAENVLNYCDSQLRKYGFKNSKMFAYPNGNVGEDKTQIEKLVSQHFDYAFNVNKDENCPLGLPISNKMDIGRIFIGKASEITDAVKAYYKRLIDDTFKNNSLLIISTHSDKSDETYLAEVLDYIISNGGEFISPSKTFEEIDSYRFQDKHKYSTEEKIVDTWIDGKQIYQKVIEITDTTKIQKDVLNKIADKPNGMTMLIKGYGIVKTYEGSYSNNDILVYSTNSGIFIKQNFTGYPERLYVIIEYIK